jgi:hypothetical protein
VPTPPPSYPAVNQFLLAEDDALKGLIEGIAVPGDKVGRTVPVYFRFPETEKQLIYPFITIDLIGIDPAYDLWTSVYVQHEGSDVFEEETTGAYESNGLHEPSVSPSVWTAPNPPDPTKPLRRLNYLPYRLYYQITTWSKYFAHDRVMTAKLIRDVIMPRPSWLRVPSDGTWKRMESLGWSAADMPTQEGNVKRIFRKVFTLSVQTEIPQDNIEHLEQRAAVRTFALRGVITDTDPDTEWTRDESHIMPGDSGWEIMAERPPS